MNILCYHAMSSELISPLNKVYFDQNEYDIMITNNGKFLFESNVFAWYLQQSINN